MAQKSGNHVKPPVPQGNAGQPHDHDSHSGNKTMKEQLAEQHHGEETGSSLQDDKKIGQHNGAGRPPRMEK